jgi:serine/threonine protein kinase
MNYSYKVDVWAIGIMTFEMLMGRTPFHSYEMKDLIYKINKGDYTVVLKEPFTIECALFLTQCLQADEVKRMNVQQILDHPYIRQGNPKDDLTLLDKAAYKEELK